MQTFVSFCFCHLPSLFWGHLPNPGSSDCPIVKVDSSPQRTHFQSSSGPLALHHSSRRYALCITIIGLCAAALMCRSSRPTVLVLMLLSEAVWNDAPAVVGPACFHFTIIPLTVDWGRSSWAETSQTDFWQRRHPKTVPCLKSLSSSVRAFLLPVFKEISWLCAWF